MTRLGDVLAAVAADLRGQTGGFALVGGLAVSVRAEPRFTRDIDLAVAVTGDGAAEGLIRNLVARGYRVVAQVEHGAAARLATVRLLPPECDAEGVIVDLLFASSGIEPETVRDAESLEILGGILAPVATIPHLVVAKLLSRDERRPQDAADLEALRRVRRPEDIVSAMTLAGLVEERGFARGRDLRRLLRDWAAA